MSPGTDNLFRTSTAKSSIMVVDDNPSNLRVLTQILTEHGYRVRPVKDSHLVMSGIKAQPPDLILMDVRMPGMNGYELCQILKDDESTQNIPVIFISALDSIQDKVTAFRLGGVDYITKPFHMEEVLVRVGTQIALKSSTEQLQKANQKLMQWNQDLESRVRSRTQELVDAYNETIKGWALALELRDYETSGHSERVTFLTVALAQSRGISGDKLINIQRGAILHDIGKMGISDNILFKPGPLTKEEWQIMQMHPIYAYQMLRPISFLKDALDIPLYHHERWNGSGYPEGLRGDKIPLAARMFAIVDVWDALSSDRPYKKAWSEEAVVAYLRENAGKEFDPELIPVFLELVQG